MEPSNCEVKECRADTSVDNFISDSQREYQ